MNETEKKIWLARFFLFELDCKQISEEEMRALLSKEETGVLFEILDIPNLDIKSHVFIIDTIGTRTDYKPEQFLPYFEKENHSSNNGAVKSAIIEALEKHPLISKQFLVSIFKKAGDDGRMKIASTLPRFEDCTVADLMPLWRSERGSTVGDTLIASIRAVAFKLPLEEVLNLLCFSSYDEIISVYIEILQSRKDAKLRRLMRALVNIPFERDSEKALAALLEPSLSLFSTRVLLGHMKNSSTSFSGMEPSLCFALEISKRGDFPIKKIDWFWELFRGNELSKLHVFLKNIGANTAVPIEKIVSIAINYNLSPAMHYHLIEGVGKSRPGVHADDILTWREKAKLPKEKGLYAEMLVFKLCQLTTPRLLQLVKEELTPNVKVAMIQELSSREDCKTDELLGLMSALGDTVLQQSLTECTEKRGDASLPTLASALKHAKSHEVVHRLIWLIRQHSDFTPDFLIAIDYKSFTPEMKFLESLAGALCHHDDVIEKHWLEIMSRTVDPEVCKIAAKHLPVRPEWSVPFALRVFEMKTTSEQQNAILDVVGMQNECTVDKLIGIIPYGIHGVRDRVLSLIQRKLEFMKIEDFLSYQEDLFKDILLRDIFERVMRNRIPDLKRIAGIK